MGAVEQLTDGAVCLEPDGMTGDPAVLQWLAAVTYSGALW